MLRSIRINTLFVGIRRSSTDTIKPNNPKSSQIFSVTEEPAVFPKPEVKNTVNLPLPLKETSMFLKLEQLQPVPESEALRKSLSFDDVPGPKYLRYFSKIWNFLPVMSTQLTASTVQYFLYAGKMFGNQLSWGNNRRFFRNLLGQYGPVVRLHGPFGGDVVILSRAEHAAVVFENEGRYPVRSCLDSLEKYRIQYRHFRRAGPFLMYGPEWENLRKAMEVPLQVVSDFQFKLMDQTSEEFVTRILRIRNKQDEVPSDFKNEINKWALECLCCITLNERLGFLEPSGLSNTSEAARALESLSGATNALRRCESGLYMWKFFNTPSWKALVKHCDQLGFILNKHICKIQDLLHQKKINGEPLNPKNVSFVEYLFLQDGLVPEDVLTIVLDMTLIGVNTVTHSIAFLLYNLAQNPRTQLKLYNELVKKPYKNENSIPPYLNACIKESLRLHPPMPILTRVLSKDILVYNYRIPKGTYVLIDTHISSMREEYFEDAHRFKPERWLDQEWCLDTENVCATMPFGYGQKSCIARAIAESQIASILTKILQAFRIEYHYGELTSTNRLLAQPDRPLKFTFIDRIHPSN